MPVVSVGNNIVSSQKKEDPKIQINKYMHAYICIIYMKQLRRLRTPKE